MSFAVILVHFFFFDPQWKGLGRVITFVQRQPNVSDVGPTLYKSYTNVLCLLGTARSPRTFLIIIK